MADRFRICIIDIGSRDYGINIVILNDNIMKMKRPFITTLFAMLLVLFTVSCSSEDKEFDNVALPIPAQLFVKQYFADATYSRVEKEKDDGFWEYEVWLSDGSKVELMRRESGRVLSANTLRSL
ncbi:hypothetical protein [Segatella copri]|uniref:hypothetical protein n=1 Tax=Segatella copri TaxID=165179 RepID=UPI001C446953|nr:hypothetical protein [Segatella copri]